MKILFRVAKEAKKYKWLLIIAAFSTLMITALNLTAPRLMSSMTAMVAAGLSEQDLQTVIWLAFGLLGLYAARVLFRYMANYLAHRAAWRLVEEMRIKVYAKLQVLSMDYYRSHQSGDLVSRTMNDTGHFEQLYAHLLPDSVTNIITVIGVTAILFSMNARLALFTCLPIPFILLSGWIFSKKVRPSFRTMQKTVGELSAQLQDNFSGIQEIQTFGQEEWALGKVQGKARTLTTAMLRALNLSAIFHPSVEFLTAMGTVFVVGIGGYIAYQGQIDVGEVVAFLLYLALFYAPITGIANLLESLQQAFAGVERVVEILDAPETVRNTPGATALQNPRGELQFDHVDFSYIEGVPVLEDVTFEVKPGEMVALVGATGVGKSTMAQLIARFYDPTSGVIRLDGRNLKDIELTSLHKNIAMVLQDTFLFNGTIAENIAFAQPDATLQEIARVAQIARIHDDILAMPDGYGTKVGERGARLSGGQKQRIAIARAILCEASVLILDEATASVDVQTEADIQQAIFDLAGTRTIVAIAHRLSTIRRADCILVFEDGRITQRGTHEELSAQPGLYRDMCAVQEKGALMTQ